MMSLVMEYLFFGGFSVKGWLNCCRVLCCYPQMEECFMILGLRLLARFGWYCSLNQSYVISWMIDDKIILEEDS